MQKQLVNYFEKSFVSCVKISAKGLHFENNSIKRECKILVNLEQIAISE